MRIVYLNPCGKMGGAETSLREVLAGVRAAEPQWELCLVLGEDGPMAEVARALNVEVFTAPFPAALARIGDAESSRLKAIGSLVPATGATAIYYGKLAKLLRQLQPDLIHTNGFKMHLLGAWTRPPKTPVIWHIHDYISTRPLMHRLLRRYKKDCAAAIVNSRSVAGDVRSVLPDLKITPIYNAVDLDVYGPGGRRADLEALSGLPPAAPDTVRVGLVATFARWKGHKTFLQALALLPREAKVRGYIIGGPIYQTNGSQWSMAELEREAAELGLGNRVGFTKFQPDTAPLMRSLDIVVHASTKPEPFGMVIIEGMACGKAVIASQAGGASEIIVDGENALAHEPGDAPGLMRQILRLAGDSALRKRLGQAGRKAAESHYNRERLAKEVLATYRSLSGASRVDHSGSAGREADATVLAAHGND